MPRNESSFKSLCRAACLVALGMLLMLAGCTQKRSRNWAQFSPLIKPNPTVTEPEHTAKLSARAEPSMLGHRHDDTKRYTQ